MRQRGFTGLEIIGIIAAAAGFMLALAAAIKVVTSYLDGVRDEAFKAGKAKCESDYKARDNEQLAKVQAELLQALKDKQALEKENARLSKALGAKVKKEKDDADAAAARTLAALNAGDLVLRDGVVLSVACPAGDSAQAQGANAGPRPGAGGTCYRLAPDIERAVVETDALVAKLAAQVNGLLEQRETDRKTCNVP